MATVIFDFDSTLISCESLENILQEKGISEKVLEEAKRIGKEAMEGKIAFIDALEKRLSLAPLYKSDFFAFGKAALGCLTPGIEELIFDLQKKQTEVWVISGAVQESLFAVCEKLHIPKGRILGVEAMWDQKNKLIGVDWRVPINRSKWEGAALFAKQWSSPKIAIGDGMTDYALLQHGLVDRFIAFTQHAKRKALIKVATEQAASVKDLRQLL